MSIWDVLGITAGKAISEPIKETGKALDKLFTSDAERMAWINKYNEIQKEISLGEMEVNKAEATSGNRFAAGWRPLCGYICCAALAWSYILHPIIIFIFNLCGITTMHEETDIANLMPILYGMLGLGGMRTFEKYTGVK